ncbi:unannotated protein [freshwater metagenome]|uniref:Unannotated protein n=1 Tax=freshwater metagenome TaxID=449393 RepID=A0A6J7HDN2_9ZZZZ
MDVPLLHLVAALERRDGTGAAGGDEVGPHAVDAEAGAGAGDQPQHPVPQDDAGQARRGGGDPGGGRLLLVAVPGREARGIGLEGQAPADDLGADAGVRGARDGDRQPEAVEELRPQIALLRVHRADEDEPRVVADGDAVALHDGLALRGGVEQHVDEVVAEEVDLVDVEDPLVGAGQQARLEHGLAVLQRSLEVQRADDPVDGRPDRQLDERRGPAVDGRQQRLERADGGGLRRAALPADQDAADVGRHRVDQERATQVVLSDEGGEGEADGGQGRADATGPPPAAAGPARDDRGPAHMSSSSRPFVSVTAFQTKMIDRNAKAV